MNRADNLSDPGKIEWGGINPMSTNEYALLAIRGDAQQILEAVAALAQALTARDRQRDEQHQALTQQMRMMQQQLQNALQVNCEAISEQIGISNRNSAGNGLQLLDLGKRLAAIEEKLGAKPISPPATYSDVYQVFERLQEIEEKLGMYPKQRRAKPAKRKKK